MFCCELFKEAYENGVINIPNISYETHKGLEMDKYYLFDRDCVEVDVRTPISFCPFCGRSVLEEKI